MTRLKIGAVYLNALVLALLGACAGGGGGSGGGLPPPIITLPPAPPAPPVFPPLGPPHADGDYPDEASAEYNANWGVRGTNAIVAWDHGATGSGVLVGVIDDGIHPEHPELRGRISPNSIDIVAGRNALVTTQSHGSEIASLIAGNYNGDQTVGVAFDATILAIRADNGSDSFSSVALANAIDYARQAGVDVINLSLGSSAPSASNFRDAIQRATEAGVIIVVSAGNDGPTAPSPNYPGFFASNPTISNGLIMVAGGLNVDGSLNTISNLPGASAPWYLTAPGWSILVPDYGPSGPVPGFQVCGLGADGDLCRIQGTSYASPHIAGAVALVMDAFPGLTPAEVVDLLLTTTDDTGAPGTDGVHGRGRLNIGRAFEPVGPLAVPLAGGDAAITASTPLGVSGAAFGDGITRNAQVWSAVGFDAYRRTFPVQLASNWLAAPNASALAVAPQLWRTRAGEANARMQVALAGDVDAPESLRPQMDRADFERTPTRIDADIGGGLSFTFAANGADTAQSADAPTGHLGFVNGSTSLRLSRQFGESVRFALLSEAHEEAGGVLTPAGWIEDRTGRSAMAAQASFSLGALDLDLLFGRIDEESGVLGLSWSTTLGGTPSGETEFVGAAWSVSPAPGWRLRGSAETGLADLGGAGWLRVAAPLRTTAFSLEAERAYTPLWLESFAPGGQGALSFALSQPLRLESGALSFLAPTATKYGRESLRFEERTFEPDPSGRELRASLGYRYGAAGAFAGFGEVIYVHQPGHVANAEAEGILRFGVRIAR